MGNNKEPEALNSFIQKTGLQEVKIEELKDFYLKHLLPKIIESELQTFLVIVVLFQPILSGMQFSKSSVISINLLVFYQ